MKSKRATTEAAGKLRTRSASTTSQRNVYRDDQSHDSLAIRRPVAPRTDELNDSVCAKLLLYIFIYLY